MERAEERDDVEALGRVTRELQRRLDRFGPGVAEERPHVAGAFGHRHDRRHFLGELHLRLVIEVRARHVQVLLRLVGNRFDDVGMRVPGARDRDAGGAVEEQVAVDVLDDGALAAGHDEGIVARVGRRHAGLVARDDGGGLRAGQGHLDIRGCAHIFSGTPEVRYAVTVIQYDGYDRYARYVGYEEPESSLLHGGRGFSPASTPGLKTGPPTSSEEVGHDVGFVPWRPARYLPSTCRITGRIRCRHLPVPAVPADRRYLPYLPYLPYAGRAALRARTPGAPSRTRRRTWSLFTSSSTLSPPLSPRG